jgi:hypothetical protein
MLVKITPEMFRNDNFVSKDGQKISFRKTLAWWNKTFILLHKGDMQICFPLK